MMPALVCRCLQLGDASFCCLVIGLQESVLLLGDWFCCLVIGLLSVMQVSAAGVGLQECVAW